MPPFVKTNLRLRDNLATFKALHRGLYHVDADDAINRMTETMEQKTTHTVTVVAHYSPLASIREMAAALNAEIDTLVNIYDDTVADAHTSRDNLSDFANKARHSLYRDLIFATAYATASVVSFTAKRRLLGLASLVAAGTHLYSFLDELDVRAPELNQRFEQLREICAYAAGDFVDFELLQSNYDFFCEVMKRRFGSAFTSDEIENVDDLAEPYVPSEFSEP